MSCDRLAEVNIGTLGGRFGSARSYSDFNPGGWKRSYVPAWTKQRVTAHGSGHNPSFVNDRSVATSSLRLPSRDSTLSFDLAP
jgi:hypothetical protein